MNVDKKRKGLIKILLDNYKQSLNNILNSKLSFKDKYKEIDLVLTKFKKQIKSIGLFRLRKNIKVKVLERSYLN